MPHGGSHVFRVPSKYYLLCRSVALRRRKRCNHYSSRIVTAANQSRSSPTGPDSVECIDAVGGVAKICMLLENLFLLLVLFYCGALHWIRTVCVRHPTYSRRRFQISTLLRMFSRAPARVTGTFSCAIRAPLGMLVAVIFRQGFRRLFPSVATKSHYVYSRINRHPCREQHEDKPQFG